MNDEMFENIVHVNRTFEQTLARVEHQNERLSELQKYLVFCPFSEVSLELSRIILTDIDAIPEPRGTGRLSFQWCELGPPRFLIWLWYLETDSPGIWNDYQNVLKEIKHFPLPDLIHLTNLHLGTIYESHLSSFYFDEIYDSKLDFSNQRLNFFTSILTDEVKNLLRISNQH
jgi:hypothetical protein